MPICSSGVIVLAQRKWHWVEDYYSDLSRTLKGFFRQFETNFDTYWDKAIDALASTVYLLELM
jgi:RNAse (barnase) inhibitor barstar